MAHLTVRMAWHDNGWNGTICKDPIANTYCSGAHSLLSERLARDKKADTEAKHAGAKLDSLMPQYLPPCYWTSAAFASHPAKVAHAHPFQKFKATKTIPESLPAYSVFTWPFRLALVHSKEIRRKDGNYHADLDKRIDRYVDRLQSNESLVFFYLNYDNPVSADEFKYALVGCARLKSTQRSGEFSFAKKELEEIRGWDGMKNFPTKNWSMRVSYDFPKTGVRLPYQEYLAYISNHPDEEEKLEQIRVLVDEPALISGVKYVSEQINDDQCLYLLYKLRRAFDNVSRHGIADPGAAPDRIDGYISEIWERRGLYPGLGRVVALLADLASGEPGRDASRGEAFVEALRKKLKSNVDLAAAVFKLLQDKAKPPAHLVAHAGVIRDARLGLRDHSALRPALEKLSLFALTERQLGRICFPQTEDGPHPFGGLKIGPNEIAKNPYVLCETYVPAIDSDRERVADLDSELKTDAPIDYFTIDIGMFPDRRYVEQNDTLQDLSVAGPERLRAFAVESLSRQESLGHTFTPIDTLVKDAQAHPLFYREKLALTRETFLGDAHLRHFHDRFHIEELDGDCFFYLRGTKEAEETVERVVGRLVAAPDHKVDLKWVDSHLAGAALELAERVPQFNVDGFKNERRRLIEGALSHRLFIITGRPGSGKTRALREVLQRLKAAGESVAVLAPTGKATLRLAEEAQWEGVQTIDRWIWRAGLGLYVENLSALKGMSRSARYEPVQNIVIDEMSMVDLPHLAVLMRAIEIHQPNELRRLILIGDENQLPPIGCGRPLQDVINHLQNSAKLESHNLVRLKTNCRQRHDPVVLDAAHLFAGKNRYFTELSGKILQGGQISPYLRVEYWNSPAELQEQVVRNVDELLKKSLNTKELESRERSMNSLFGLYDNGFVKDRREHKFSVDRAQILSPYRGGPSGAEGLSELIRKTYRHDAWPGHTYPNSPFGHSDKLICLRNIYRWNVEEKRKELYFSNGSIGFLCDNRKGRNLYFPEIEWPVSWAFDNDDFDLAYAITVHKAQGSEFEEVYVVIPERRALLSRELVYTALTRSKGPLTIFVQKTERENPLEVARNRSVLLFRNSSLFGKPFNSQRMYEPERGVLVQSKIEFIIYQALRHARDHGSLAFAYESPRELTVDGRRIKVRPDFTIVAGSKTYYWEHLGMLDLRDYATKWKDRRAGYEAEGLGSELLTTDDLSGVLQERVEEVIKDLINGTLKKSRGSEFSHHHYVLGVHS